MRQTNRRVRLKGWLPQLIKVSLGSEVKQRSQTAVVWLYLGRSESWPAPWKAVSPRKDSGELTVNKNKRLICLLYHWMCTIPSTYYDIHTVVQYVYLALYPGSCVQVYHYTGTTLWLKTTLYQYTKIIYRYNILNCSSTSHIQHVFDKTLLIERCKIVCLRRLHMRDLNYENYIKIKYIVRETVSVYGDILWHPPPLLY